MESFTPLFWVACGAVPGALGRFYVGQFCARRWGTQFPWGTLIVNLSGSFGIGAADDLQRVTAIAEQMVSTYGMSSVLGPLAYNQAPSNSF